MFPDSQWRWKAASYLIYLKPTGSCGYLIESLVPWRLLVLCGEGGWSNSDDQRPASWLADCSVVFAAMNRDGFCRRERFAFAFAYSGEESLRSFLLCPPPAAARDVGKLSGLSCAKSGHSGYLPQQRDHFELGTST